MSFANNLIVTSSLTEPVISHMSLILMINNTGPKTLPWGTSLITLHSWDCVCRWLVVRFLTYLCESNSCSRRMLPTSPNEWTNWQLRLSKFSNNYECFTIRLYSKLSAVIFLIAKRSLANKCQHSCWVWTFFLQHSNGTLYLQAVEIPLEITIQTFLSS